MVKVLVNLSWKAGEDQGSSSKTIRQRELFLTQTFIVFKAFSGFTEPHPHWEGQSVFISLPI